MSKRIFFLVLLAVALFSGCATGRGIRRGLKEDFKAAGSAIGRADQWFRENCW